MHGEDGITTLTVVVILPTSGGCGRKMKSEKIKKWKEDREHALDLYKTTDMKISQIARAIRRSTTTTDKMITGKGLPKFITEEDKEVNPVLEHVNKTNLSKEDIEIIETAISGINEILVNNDIFLRDGTVDLIRMAVTTAIMKEKNLGLAHTLEEIKSLGYGGD